jgi:hypothetical protein
MYCTACGADIGARGSLRCKCSRTNRSLAGIRKLFKETGRTLEGIATGISEIFFFCFCVALLLAFLFGVIWIIKHMWMAA